MKDLKKISVLGEYDVLIGRDLLAKIDEVIDFSKYSRVIVITDLNLDKFWLEKISGKLPKNFRKVVVGDGEKSKNIDSIKRIWQMLLWFKADRKSLVINLGGGAIGDMGGFAASTYMRGISFIQIPTTLLAQVDASIGGKVAIDFEGVKNLIGAFNQPAKVVIDVATLETLPKREFISGFGEIIKHGLIADKEYFDSVISKKPEEFSLAELAEIIEKSCLIKSEIINEDEKEIGQRKILNFGHTFGHAVESLSLETGEPLLHGEAVSIGMVVEAMISKMTGKIGEKDFEMIKNSLEKAGLPIKIPDFSEDDILKVLKSDKKSEKGVIKWTLIEGIGQAVINQEVEEKEIYEAIKNLAVK